MTDCPPWCEADHTTDELQQVIRDAEFALLLEDAPPLAGGQVLAEDSEPVHAMDLGHGVRLYVQASDLSVIVDRCLELTVEEAEAVARELLRAVQVARGQAL